MGRVLIVVSHYLTIYSLRKEFVDELINLNYEVYIALPNSEEAGYFKEIGCHIIDTPMERRKTNPLSDFKLLMQYVNIIRKTSPDVVLTYTIKPNIYGSLASKLTNTPVLNTVTGLGSVFINELWIKKMIVPVYKKAFSIKEPIFFLNHDNEKYYKEINIIEEEHPTIIVPGSGVNLEKFHYKELDVSKPIKFTFIGRIIKDKGIEEFLLAAQKVKKEIPEITFEVVGLVDDKKYEDMLSNYEKSNIIKYLGSREDIPDIMADTSCVVLPSYGEGRGTVLQEGASVGRPLITCNTYGCRENVMDGYNGFLCEVKNYQSLASAFQKFIQLSESDKIKMGRNSRLKAVEEFDRNAVIQKYIKEIEKINRK